MHHSAWSTGSSAGTQTVSFQMGTSLFLPFLKTARELSVSPDTLLRNHEMQDATLASSPASTETFSLEFNLQAQHPVNDGFETLKARHSSVIDTLFPSDLARSQPSSTEYSESTTTASSDSPSQIHPIQDLHAKPQFSLATADHLLTSFRSMLIHFPCTLLPAETSVQQLATTRPFVLLAILSAASGSRNLQNNTLYDEEFRKVLGLKFTTSGERSLELLQGILIYCAWYAALLLHLDVLPLTSTLNVSGIRSI
jgi:hypothetical protein